MSFSRSMICLITPSFRGCGSKTQTAGNSPVPLTRMKTADALGLAQPQVSKHLRMLREVGAVDVREQGRQRLYRLNGHALKPIHDWVKTYERSWSERFDRLDVVLEDLKRKEQGDGSDE